MYWAVGFAFAFGIGDDHRPRRLLPARLRRSADGVPGHGPLRRHDRDEVDVPVLVLRRLAGDRLGDDARADQVRRLHHLRESIFAGFIYPMASHWVFGGGWLQTNLGMQDFAGSTAVHLIGATGALAVLLQLGARRGKYGGRRAPAGDPGPLDAAVRPRRADPVARLVRVQPGLHARRDGRPLPRGRAGDDAGGRAPACSPRSAPPTGRPARSTSAWPATARSAPWWPSPRRRATSSRGRRRSSARSPASSSRSASTRSTRRSTTRSAR